MEITINDQRKIVAVQKEFSEMYPGLKLEFFSKSNRGSGPPSDKLMKHISKTIAECRTVHNSGMIAIQPNMTVGELEQGFRDIYGISVKVYRKSGNNWEETSETEKGTLANQNTEGIRLMEAEKAI